LRFWLKDYGWTPAGSFKLLGALSWMANSLERIGDRPVAAHSSGKPTGQIAEMSIVPIVEKFDRRLRARNDELLDELAVVLGDLVERETSIVEYVV
jgi:hypothetical protein